MSNAILSNAILGLSSYYHDSAAALLVDGEIIAAAQEERFSRKKFDERFPQQAIRYVLAEAGLAPKDLRTVVFYDKPLLKFERLLETYHAQAPRGFTSFMASMPVWLEQKLFMRQLLKKALAELSITPERLLFSEHHLSHAASAFFPSPFKDAAILTIDGVGEWATTTIADGSAHGITVLREQHFPHSLGLLYSAFTAFCGFRVNSGEYKLMGLAPYGIDGSPEVETIKQKIKTHMVDVRDDGSLLLNMRYFAFATGLRMNDDGRWKALFGVGPRAPESPLDTIYLQLALAIQQICEEVILKLAQTARTLTKREALVLAGGVALNCVANGKLLRSGIFSDLWVQPAAGDAGGALGAALAAWHIGDNQPRRIVTARGETKDSMAGSYLGPAFGSDDIQRVAKRYQAPHTHFPNRQALCDRVADLLAQGHVVGWFQGRMEYGPRALGNRSILGDPRNPEMQKRLNLKIKFREGFRPFAPSVLAEDVSHYFALQKPSPYMLLVAPVSEAQRHSLPADYADWSVSDKLYFLRSTLPSITHVDYSARIQTVHEETNPRYHQLISAFKRQTGCGLLVNTSFNVRGEPIVCTPDDAYRCFMRTEMDWLVMEDCLFERLEQPLLASEKQGPLALD